MKEAMEPHQQNQSLVELGEKLFRSRDYTAIPLVILVLFAAEPSVPSATVGTLVVLVGEILRIYGVSFLGAVSRTRSDSTGSTLVTSGPFTHIRNPQYLANIIICTGMGIYAGVGWLLLIIVAASTFQYYCIVKYEERLLLEKFGETYQRYLDSTPAWVPNRFPSFKELEWPQSIQPALHSERRTLTAIVLSLLAMMLTAKK